MSLYPPEITNCITDSRLMVCEYCKIPEDTASLWKLKCKSTRHKFTELYTSKLFQPTQTEQEEK